MIIFNIILMIPIAMQFHNKGFAHSKSNSQTIEHAYMIYSPKILKFIYHSPPKQVDQTNYIRREQLWKTQRNFKLPQNNSKIIPLNKANPKRNTVNNKSDQLKIIAIHPLNSKKRSRRNKPFLDGNQNSRFSVKTEPAQMLQRPNHITVNSFVDSFSCEIFSQCSEMHLVDEGERRPLDFDDSRQTIDKNQLYFNQSVRLSPEFKTNKDKSQFLSQSFQKSGNRTKIFENEPLNLTVDLGTVRKEERSRSKNSIFKPRERTEVSRSMERSLSKRKKIFEPWKKDSPTFVVISNEQSMGNGEIPKSILESWQKFSQSSCSNQVVKSPKNLDVVREVNLQESQVRLM